MNKLFATDLDGTLINNNKIKSDDRQALLNLQNKGNLVVVSTGRPYNAIQMLKDQYKIHANYFVLLNGALIMDSTGSKIKQEIIEKELIEKILYEINEDNVDISVESGFKTYILTECNNLPYPNKIKVNSIQEIDDDLSLISLHMPNKEKAEIEELKNEINNKYGDKIIAYRNDIYIDIVPIGCSKGNGVEYLANQELIKSENLYTIGDSWNDISMFNITPNSFTFNHVEEELKKHTRYIVNSVSHCIEDYIL
jgi:Cof subfamily protein (haloacid dehalogenase superfamily)